jgi:hypothetical protein
MAYLVVGIMNATGEQRNELNEYLATIGGYWHWMPDLWLVNTNGDEDPAEVRDAIHAQHPTLVCLVLKLDLPEGRRNWAGSFPTNEVDKWADWLNEFWKRGV